jgi:hypothetical protein
MTEFCVYIEGGGNTAQQKKELRLGFQAFFRELLDGASDRGHTMWIILCGGRQNTFEDFQTAQRANPKAVNILLVDAEAPVVTTPWAHLSGHDGWRTPGVGDDVCHLMVQTVEAWLVADPNALADYYGHGFRCEVLPRRPDVEDIPKADLLPALERASQDTAKGRYRKIQHCAELLGRLDTAAVRQRASHCERLFVTLSALLSR